MMEMPKNNNSKNEQQQQQQQLVYRGKGLSRQRSMPAPQNNNDHHKSLSREELKLAAVAVSLNVRLRSADMPISMMERAFRYARSVLDTAAASSTSAAHRPSPTLLARSLKKEFDSSYGPAWHCVVGKSYGSFVTHSPGGFVYFSVDSFSFLLFKTEVHLVQD